MESVIGWLVIGLIAGSVSGWIVGVRSVDGCLPTIVVGVIGGFVGGWLSEQMQFGRVEGFLGALIVATFGAIVVRIVLQALESNR